MFWELTRACSLACKHCRAEAVTRRHPDELTTEECISLIDELSTLKPKPTIIVTGGDPIMRDDLFEILAHATSNLRVAVAFSGTRKAARRVEDLKEVGVARIAVSVDGNEEVHDSFRGVRGSYRMSVELLEAAKSVGLPFQINTTVSRETIDSLPEVAKLAASLGAEMWDVFFVVPTGRASIDLMPKPQEFEDILCWLYDVAKRTGMSVKSSAATHMRRIEAMRGCGEMPTVGELYRKLSKRLDELPIAARVAKGSIGRIPGITDGRGMMFVSHVGEVYPSGFLPISAGNVRERSVIEIYRTSRIFVELRDPDRLKGKCGVCEYRRICGGSRARAYAVHGDYLAEEPCCTYVPRRLSKTNSSNR